MTKRKPRVAFAIQEDTHLISSWLNISTDPIVGVGQGKKAFWLRVTKNYNKLRGELRKRAVNQLKSPWQKINVVVQKFKGHYKQVVSLKKSGCTDNDVMLNAYVIWKEDEGVDFGLEQVFVPQQVYRFAQVIYKIVRPSIVSTGNLFHLDYVYSVCKHF